MTWVLSGHNVKSIVESNTYSSLKAVKFDSVTGSSTKLVKKLNKFLTVSPNIGKVSTGYIDIV